MIFRDVNPWAFLSSLSLPYPIPCSSERELNVKTRLRLFSLSLALSFPALSRWRSFIVKFALGYGFVSLTRRFFLNIFFPSVLGYRCYCVAAPSRFAFLARSGRDERAVQGEHLVEQFAPSGSFWSTDCNNDDSMECIWPLKFLGNANATHRGTPKGFKGAEIVSAVMKYAGAQRDSADPSFYLPSWSNGKLIPQAEEHLHSRNSRQIPYMKHELPLGLAKVPKHRYMKYA